MLLVDGVILPGTIQADKLSYGLVFIIPPWLSMPR